MRVARLYFRTLLGIVVLVIGSSTVFAQSRVNSSGTGGIHTIQGRVYLPNGRTLDSSIQVELQSNNFSTISVYTDVNGGFAFRALAPGNYSVVVNAPSENFETVREYVTIDTEVQGTVRILPPPKTITLPIYLQLKRTVALRNEVINARWSAIPKAAMERFRRGVLLVQEGKDAEAEVEFRKAVELSPNFSPAHTELGKLALKKGNLEAAIQSSQRAIKYDDSDFDAHLNLGIAYLNLRKYDQAEPELVAAAYINRTAVTPHYYLGLVFVMKNDLNVAQKAFETAKELNGGKSLPNIHKYLGRIYLRKDMEKEAIRELETYLKLAPKAQDAEKVRKDISDIKAKHLKNDFV